MERKQYSIHGDIICGLPDMYHIPAIGQKLNDKNVRAWLDFNDYGESCAGILFSLQEYPCLFPVLPCMGLQCCLYFFTLQTNSFSTLSISTLNYASPLNCSTALHCLML